MNTYKVYIVEFVSREKEVVRVVEFDNHKDAMYEARSSIGQQYQDGTAATGFDNFNLRIEEREIKR